MAFAAARVHTDGLRALTLDNFGALDAQALALAGLGDVDAARAVNSDAGIVQRATRLLAQLPGVEPFW